MAKNVLTENATKAEIVEWLKQTDKQVEVDPGRPGNINDKIKKVIAEQAKKNKADGSNSNNSHDDTPTNKVPVIKPRKPQPVEIKYDGGNYKTSWIVTFDLDRPQRLDQKGFTQLLIKMIDGHVIFDKDRKIFWIYNSKRWVALDSGLADLRQFAMQAVDIFITNLRASTTTVDYDTQLGIYVAIPKPQKSDDQSDKDFKAKLSDWKRISMLVKKYNHFLDFIQRNSVIKQSFEELKAELGCTNIKFDDHDYLLNCLNGVINLKNGKLLSHDPDLLLTRIAPVNYRPDAKHPALDKTLKISFQNDQEMIDYVKKQAGYFIVGGNQDEHLFMWYGPLARNGKSTIANAIGRVLGAETTNLSGYAKELPVETFLASGFADDGKSADPNLAGLQGIRLAIASEPNRNAKFNSGKIKQITGDRLITARFLHQDPATFRALFKILITCNFLPQSDGDASIKRRINIVEFGHHIKEGSLEDDPEIDSKLWAEREGLLAWCVEGAVLNYKTRQKRIEKKEQLIQKVRQEGKSLEDTNNVIFEDPLLPQPKNVKKAIDGYLFSANSAAQFLHQTVVTKAEYWEILHDTVFKKFDINRYYDAYDAKNGDTYKYQYDSHYFEPADEKLLCLPNAYTLRTNLFKMYRNWAKDQGISRPMAAHSFYEVADRYLVPARTRKGQVYLGIIPTPMPGTKAKNQLYKYDWVDSGDLKFVIYKTGERYQHSHFEDVEDGAQKLETLYNRFKLLKEDTSSKVQVNKLKQFADLNDSLYFGRLKNAEDSSGIDFKRDYEDLEGYSHGNEDIGEFDDGTKEEFHSLFED
ncbi:phage/plasmid primase, P4 family [Limosilactobacillus reuteri]|uniref:Phage/plasmid primase, P4 family n=1 Tax=Limosilactobacillus reuteri TaxID=1598 RepID=A0AAW4X5C4_LIMRT|nr:DNA primase family protein [Limosilactobacillus reuteri]MCC4477571.1 phage/plasmid primase, P4 family [Limosilactobacillus reuteri]MCC4479523.1 phage/plasmid primase, P4 family [Limosilactobacillus reuteri]MCC4488811.1 phage/plasmid primase, P4 family [Limosilactobacillus reuteri]MCC4493460.1 phage/plasmid primase, P4 family [Limosilactobacillus reuteri]MCC4495444.1 phage/plasmid primase, P4 family [Limosilactobacillus reuteri]